MPKKSKKQENKEERIEKEIKRLNKVFTNMNEKNKTISKRLIENVAFMSVCLEDLKDAINSEGVKEMYLNGPNQHGYKETVEVKTYNTMIKNYINGIKQLNDMLPKDEKINEEDEFDKFCDKL